jgi:hypothetical protein
MKQQKKYHSLRNSSLIRAFLLCTLLVGCQFIGSALLRPVHASMQNHAASLNKGKQEKPSGSPSDATATVNGTATATEDRAGIKKTNEDEKNSKRIYDDTKDKQHFSDNNKHRDKDTSDSTTLAPDLAITKGVENYKRHFTVGENVTFRLTAWNRKSAGPVKEPGSILVTDIIPVGLRDITVRGSDWAIAITSTISPTRITATYVGTYPVLSGEVLPSIEITGELTKNAVPNLTDTAIVGVPGDTNANNNVSTRIICVEKQEEEHHKHHHHHHQRHHEEHHEHHEEHHEHHEHHEEHHEHAPTLPRTGSDPRG